MNVPRRLAAVAGWSDNRDAEISYCFQLIVEDHKLCIVIVALGVMSTTEFDGRKVNMRNPQFLVVCQNPP